MKLASCVPVVPRITTDLLRRSAGRLGPDGGFGDDGFHGHQDLVRLLNNPDLVHLGPGPEQPNINLLDPNAAGSLQAFCGRISRHLGQPVRVRKAIRSHWGDDAAIACCVSRCRVGKRCAVLRRSFENSAKACCTPINGDVRADGMQASTRGQRPIKRTRWARGINEKSQGPTRKASNGCPRPTLMVSEHFIPLTC